MANRLTHDTVAEERSVGPRLEGWATPRLLPTLRDASLRDAPQGEAVCGAGNPRTFLTSRLQELQQVDLGLDGTAADRGELHRLHRPRQMPPCLLMADDAPAHRAEHLPPVRARGIDRGAAGALVGPPQLLAAAEAAGRFV